MRVRILKDFATANGFFHAGQITDIDPGKAEGWLRAGLVMQDKSLDGPSETKEPPPVPPPGPEAVIGKGFPRKPKSKSKKRAK